MPPAAKSTKEEIVLAGERLIADHGVDGVSMRQIGADDRERQQLGGPLPLRFEGEARRGDLRVPAPALARTPRRTRCWATSIGLAGLAGVPGRRRPRAERTPRQQLHALCRVHLPTRWGGVQAPASAVRERSARIRGATARLPQPCRRTAAHAPTRAGHGDDRACSREPRTLRAQRRPALPLALESANLVDCMVGFLEAPVSPAVPRCARASQSHCRPPDAVRLSGSRSLPLGDRRGDPSSAADCGERFDDARRCERCG